MKIPVILNGQEDSLEAENNENLLTVLRRKGLLSVKCGCESGNCGNCMVLLDDIPVKSCRVPVAIVRDCKIVTLEGFKESTYFEIISAGFKEADIDLCGYCNSGKIFTAYTIIKDVKDSELPDSKTIEDATKGLCSCCCDKTTLYNGIIYSYAIKKSQGDNFNNGKQKRKK